LLTSLALLAAGGRLQLRFASQTLIQNLPAFQLEQVLLDIRATCLGEYELIEIECSTYQRSP
jgi:hypothetical protein